MKKYKVAVIIAVLLSLFFNFNCYSMERFVGSIYNNEGGYIDNEGNYAKDCWAWMDGYCYHFNEEGFIDAGKYIDGYGVDLLGRWTELIPGTEEKWMPVERTVFTGQWITTEGGSKNFLFDDGTVALGYQKIDGNLYYFKATGVLAVNYEANCGTTNENGIITELISGKRANGRRRQLEEIQNLPECFTRKEESKTTE